MSALKYYGIPFCLTKQPSQPLQILFQYLTLSLLAALAKVNQKRVKYVDSNLQNLYILGTKGLSTLWIVQTDPFFEGLEHNRIVLLTVCIRHGLWCKGVELDADSPYTIQIYSIIPDSVLVRYYDYVFVNVHL